MAGAWVRTTSLDGLNSFFQLPHRARKASRKLYSSRSVCWPLPGCICLVWLLATGQGDTYSNNIQYCTVSLPYVYDTHAMARGERRRRRSARERGTLQVYRVGYTTRIYCQRTTTSEGEVIECNGRSGTRETTETRLCLLYV